MKSKQFTPVTIYYSSSMLEFFDAAREEMENDGLQFQGIEWEVKGGKLEITITIEQAERHLLQLGIKVGKAFMKDALSPKTTTIGELVDKGQLPG